MSANASFDHARAAALGLLRGNRIPPATQAARLLHIVHCTHSTGAYRQGYTLRHKPCPPEYASRAGHLGGYSDFWALNDDDNYATLATAAHMRSAQT